MMFACRVGSLPQHDILGGKRGVVVQICPKEDVVGQTCLKEEVAVDTCPEEEVAVQSCPKKEVAIFCDLQEIAV